MRPLRQTTFLALMPLLTSLLGCTDLIMSKSTLDTDKQWHGLVYSLPKGQAMVTVTRLPIGPDTLASAQAQAASAAKAVANDAASLAKATASGDNTSIATAKAQQSSDQAALDAANTSVNNAKSNQGKWNETVSLAILPIVPDSTARFVAKLNHEPSRDDNLKLSVVNGLLTTTAATSTDQTPNLIVTAADTVITLAALAGGVPLPAVPAAPPVAPSPPCFYSMSEIFDPTNSAELKDVQTELLARHLVLQSSAVAGDPGKQGIDPQEKGEISGLVYRVATAVVVTVSPTADAMNPGIDCPLQSVPVAQAVYSNMPDSRSQFVLSSKVGAFTTTTFNFGFSNGMLTDYNVQRPSEIAAVAGIPLRIANDILQIPAQIIQLKVSYDSAATAESNAQAALQQAKIQQQTALVNAQNALVTARAALTQSNLSQPVAALNAQTAVTQAEQALNKAIATLNSGTSP